MQEPVETLGYAPRLNGSRAFPQASTLLATEGWNRPGTAVPGRPGDTRV